MNVNKGSIINYFYIKNLVVELFIYKLKDNICFFGNDRLEILDKKSNNIMFTDYFESYYNYNNFIILDKKENIFGICSNNGAAAKYMMIFQIKNNR